MSAFLVSDKHINALVHYAAIKEIKFHFDGDGNKRIYDPRDVEDAQFLCELLFKENVRSLCSRYADEKPEDYPMTVIYELRQPKRTAIEIVKACDCYAYQACESPDWKDTDACRLVDWIKSEAISALPGYDTAKWGIN